ncbi:MAG: DUF4445 domain-containing protein [Candidatus Methanofastidiosa archaeon]|nr:DUF4445 domain-containing protein [Candidatus Methanofastidiosa archaeon]
MYTITFQPSGIKIKVEEGTTILEAANEAGIGIDAPCGGKGTCGKCKVYLNKGQLNDVSAAERKNLTVDEINAGCRLACKAIVHGHCVIDVPEESLLGEQKILIEGAETEIRIDPLVRYFSVVLPTPTLEDNKCDHHRLEDAIRKVSGYESIDMDLSTLRELPNLIRDNKYDISISMFRNRAMNIYKSQYRDLYGAAVDIGTTTMVAYIMNMTTGEIVGIGSMMNPQIPYGDDLMARISYSFQQDKLKRLQGVVVDGVNKIISEGCNKAGITISDISEVTIVGNTAMHHIFLGIYPKYLSLAPYCPAVQQAIDCRPSEIGLNTNPAGNCHVLPVVAGFVGADHLAVILSCDIHNRDEMTLAIDVGTNGEIVLGNKDGMICCSAAAGPALEGSCITYGMRAADGAIERVNIKKGSLKVDYKTINNSRPLGICGSGIIDLVAEMLKTAVIDVTGRIREELEDGNERIREGDRGYEFVVEWARKTKQKKDIVITANDLREVQLAKAAMYAGTSILMEKQGITVKDIDRVMIAGAFGSYIDVENAMTIGLFPEVPLEKVKSVGNAAGTGARMSLISKEKRDEEKEILRKLKYVELATHSTFQDQFVDAMNMPHKDLSLFPRVMKNVSAPIPKQ